MYLSDGGSKNTAIGMRALNQFTLVGGDENVAVGYESLYFNTSGANNTALGYRAGGANITGSNNTFIGYNAGSSLPDSSDNCIVLGNNDVEYLFCKIQNISALSDQRDKKDIIDIPYGLDLINTLQPRQFTWDMRGETDDNPNQGKRRIGFIAQEVQAVLGEDNNVLNMVNGGNTNRLTLSYGQLVPVLTKAVQELHEQLMVEKAKTAAFEARLAALEANSN